MSKQELQIATTKDAFHKIVKELEFIFKQSFSIYPKVKIQIHKDMDLNEFIQYTERSAPEIFKNGDAVIVHMFLYWIIEVNEISAKSFENIISENKHYINLHVTKSSLNKRILSQPFSKISSLEKRPEYRMKFVSYLNLFCEDVSEVSFFYADVEDQAFNKKILSYLIEKDAFKRKSTQSKFDSLISPKSIIWSVEKFLIDLNNKDSKTLLSFIKKNKDLEGQVVWMAVDDRLSLNPQIDEYFMEKFIEENPMIQYVKESERRFVSLRSQVSKFPPELGTNSFKEKSLKSFLYDHYGFNGPSIAKSFTNYMKYSSGFDIASHTIAGITLKNLFSKYENKTKFEVPYANYISELLNNSHVVKMICDNKESLHILTDILSPYQIYSLLGKMHQSNELFVKSSLESFKSIKKATIENEKRFYAILNKTSFYNYNSWVRLNNFLQRESSEAQTRNANLKKNTEYSFKKMKGFDLGEGYSIDLPQTHYDMADLRLQFGHSLLKKFNKVQQESVFLTLKKDNTPKFFINVGAATEYSVLYDKYIIKNRPDESDYENKNAHIEFGDQIIVDCLSYSKKTISNSVMDLPNSVFQNLCVILAKNDLLSEKYFALNIKAQTMTKEFVYELKEQGVVDSTPLEMLDWNLRTVFKKDIVDEKPAADIVTFSYLDENIQTVNKVLNNQPDLARSIAEESGVAESFAKDFIAYICDFNLDWDTELKSVSKEVYLCKKNLKLDVMTEVVGVGRSFPELMAHFKSHMILARVLNELREDGAVVFDGEMYICKENILSVIKKSFEESDFCTWDDLKRVSRIDKDVLKQIVHEICDYKMKKVNRQWTVMYSLKDEHKMFSGLTTESEVR